MTCKIGPRETNPFGVKSAKNKVLEVRTILAIVIRLIVVGGVTTGSLTLALDTVGLGILHLLIVVLLLLSSLDELPQSSSLLLLLGLGGIAGATIGLILIRLVISTEEGGKIIIHLIVLILETGDGLLNNTQCRASDGRDLAIIVCLRLLGRVDRGHGDAELRIPQVSRIQSNPAIGPCYSVHKVSQGWGAL